jgi:hypothetical protein
MFFGLCHVPHAIAIRLAVIFKARGERKSERPKFEYRMRSLTVSGSSRGVSISDCRMKTVRRQTRHRTRSKADDRSRRTTPTTNLKYAHHTSPCVLRIAKAFTQTFICNTTSQKFIVREGEIGQERFTQQILHKSIQSTDQKQKTIHTLGLIL